MSTNKACNDGFHVLPFCCGGSKHLWKERVHYALVEVNCSSRKLSIKTCEFSHPTVVSCTVTSRREESTVWCVKPIL